VKPSTPAERVFREITGRDVEPGERIEELICVSGRRGGKSFGIAVLAVYIACCRTHESLVRGETGVVLIIAPDARQAGIALNYVQAALEGPPILSQLIDERTADTLRLTTNIALRSASFRRLRGMTPLAVVIDEGAFLQTDDAPSLSISLDQCQTKPPRILGPLDQGPSTRK
jgi:phage terminase large subunit-like protein